LPALSRNQSEHGWIESEVVVMVVEDMTEHPRPTKGCPSEEMVHPWLYAFRQESHYPAPTENSGKWLLFIPRKSINRRWAQIRDATERGLLGHMSRVSTVARGEEHERHAVCVCTYDGMDREDAMRVRAQLRTMGFDRPLRYKLDSDTRQGRYGDGYVPVYHE
jgi:hypothetical protein